MYITYNSKDYPCKCRPSSTMRYRELPEDFHAPVNGEIKLYADNGFHMRTDDPADYLRQTFEHGVLTLTNEPETEPMPQPQPVPGPTAEERLAALEAAMLAMMEVQSNV